MSSPTSQIITTEPTLANLLEVASETVLPPLTLELLLKTDLRRLVLAAGVNSDSELLEQRRPRFADSKNETVEANLREAGAPDGVNEPPSLRCCHRLHTPANRPFVADSLNGITIAISK